ncbi:hypothetical protein LTR84_011970 [Exophiala bonariae]|uniref:Uncharacterized protein n=1 Tax=Exophiala bonariae TaxID=1690606 RepID=A0AAV9MT81_9EURO|nr:hypothetical protein LTR84_011970 [Exophiala bonariae]
MLGAERWIWRHVDTGGEGRRWQAWGIGWTSHAGTDYQTQLHKVRAALETVARALVLLNSQQKLGAEARQNWES